MFRAVSNLLFRHRDPTRGWVGDLSHLIVDVRGCTLCGVALGGNFAGLSALGPSENARQAARDLLDWRSCGVFCTIDDSRIADFTIVVAPSGNLQRFPGTILCDGRPLAVSSETTADELVKLVGEPFVRSDADGETVVFYEYAVGEVQFAFDRQFGRLESIELNYEPELSWPEPLAMYANDKPFPEDFRRRLPRVPATLG